MFASAESHFERVEFAIQLDVLRRKSEHVGDLGKGRRLAEALAEIVAVMEKDAACIGAEVSERAARDHRSYIPQLVFDILELRRDRVRCPIGGSSIEPGGVDGADDYLLLQGTVRDGVHFRPLGLGYEARRDQHQTALARHARQAAN